MIVLLVKLEEFLVWLTKSELTRCLQNFIKITNRLHDVWETKKNAVHARESFIYSCIHEFRVYLTTLSVVNHIRFEIGRIFPITLLDYESVAEIG